MVSRPTSERSSPSLDPPLQRVQRAHPPRPVVTSPTGMTIRARLEASGIRRFGGPRNGFRYRKAGGEPASESELQRIEQLKIPPQWKDVSIAASPRAAVQAVGRDTAGRW